MTNPFQNVIASGPLSARTVTRGQLPRPYPHFTGISAQSLPQGSSRYDGLQMKAVRRFSNGFSMTASYAISKQLEQVRFLNDQDTTLVKELNNFDIPQRVVFSGAYALPLGPGKALFGNAKGLTARLVEGMQINVLYMAQSGVPLTIAGAESVGRSAKMDNPTVQQGFDTSAFRQRQGIEQVRTSTLPDVRSGGKDNFDLSFFKTIQMSERIRLQFRAEAFNALNRPEWSSPNMTFGNPTSGR